MRSPEIVGVVFLVIIGVIAVVSILVRHFRLRREILHQERLKYLERGLAPPDTNRGPTDRERVLHNSFWISFWTGGVVPVVAVIAGAITSSEMRFSYGNQTEAMLFLWGGVVAICLAGVASAAAIMVSTNRRPEDHIPHMPGNPRGYHPPAGAPDQPSARY